jgi:ribosome-associated protein
MIRRRHDDQLPDEERPSKGARKRASQELQDLGEELIELSDALLDTLPLPENLRDAVLAARRFTSHGAQLRQRQYIGKLMRKIDTDEIRVALQAHRQKENAAARQFQRIEQWRARLLTEPAALGELLAACPRAESSIVQRLVASTHEEARRGSPPRSSRELFHYLREILLDPSPEA